MRRILWILMAIGFGLILSLQAPVDAQEASQKWEYQFVVYTLPVPGAAGLGDVANAIVATATPAPPLDMAAQVTQRLNEFGLDGWELIASDIIPGGVSPAFAWTFKRPLN